MSLQNTLRAIAADFAAKIVEALRGASINDLSGAAGARSVARPATAAKNASGRLARRSDDDIAHTLQRIVATLKHAPSGLRAEEIKAALYLDKREMPKPIAMGLSTGVLTKSGQKRATVYALGSGSASATTKAPAKRAKRKAAAKK